MRKTPVKHDQHDKHAPLDIVDPHSRFYLGVVGAAGETGALLGGPPGALIGAGIGLAGCAVHYVSERRKPQGGSDGQP